MVRKGKLVYGNPAPLRAAALRSAFEGGGMLTLANFFQIPNASFRDPNAVCQPGDGPDDHDLNAETGRGQR